MNLSIIVPCYNEEKIIGATLARIVEYLKNLDLISEFEIWVVDDGSKDGTARAVKEVTKTTPQVHLHSFDYNQGRGAAVIQGLGLAQHEYVLVLDADLSYDTFHIKDVMMVFKNDPAADCVVVSPYAPRGQVKNVPALRLLISRMANKILSRSFSLKLSTVTAVVRGYRRSAYQGIQFIERGKELHLEILRNLDLAGAKIVEIPGVLEWKDKARTGRLKWGQIFETTRKHLVYGLLARPTRFLKFLTVFTLGIGLYETILLFLAMLKYFVWVPEGFAKSTWLALSATLNASPHTVVLAAVGLILGFQSLAFLVTLKVLNLQQRELLAHTFRIQKKLWTEKEQ